MFSDWDYKDAGACITDDLSDADILIGVKEVPIRNLIDDKTYIFFSHTTKAQPYNMPLLDEILKRNITLVDHEMITDGAGVRLVKFDTLLALLAVDSIRALGERLLSLSNAPFCTLVWACACMSKVCHGIYGENWQDHCG